MGVYSNSTSIIQARIIGDLAHTPSFDWLSQSLAGRAFSSIEDTTDESTEGWVRTDKNDNSSFDAPGAFMRDHYVFFSYRHDKRKINSTVLKSHVSRAETDYLLKHPELKRPPKRIREEIEERVKLQLFSKTLPIPSVVDVVWDLNKSVFTIFTSSLKTVEKLEELFSKTFEGLKLQLIYPYARGLSVLGTGAEDMLKNINQADSDAAIDEIQSNRWIGADFLRWLLCNGVNGDDTYQVAAPGHIEAATSFTAWVDDKIQFKGGGEGGPQKVAVSGSQDKYAEARTALLMGKDITGAVVYIEEGESQWKLRLDAEMFIFSSLKCPQVKIERQGVEELTEMESAFYERMYLLESCLQLFDSMLTKFLHIRCDQRAWEAWDSMYQKWLAGEE